MKKSFKMMMFVSLIFMSFSSQANIVDSCKELSEDLLPQLATEVSIGKLLKVDAQKSQIQDNTLTCVTYFDLGDDYHWYGVQMVTSIYNVTQYSYLYQDHQVEWVKEY
jgi:hypothetical protein